MPAPLTENDRLPAKSERIAVPDSAAPQESVWSDPAAWAVLAVALAVVAWLVLRRRR